MNHDGKALVEKVIYIFISVEPSHHGGGGMVFNMGDESHSLEQDVEWSKMR